MPDVKSSSTKSPHQPSALKLSSQTQLIHGPKVLTSSDNEPLVEPIYQSVKFYNQSLTDLRKSGTPGAPRFVYSRSSNPTVRALELQLASMQGCEEGLAVSTGVAAISTLLWALLKQGDHVLYFWESYRPTRFLIRELLNKFGVESTGLFADQASEIEKWIQPGKTRMVIMESPTNPQLRILPLRTITAAARRQGVWTALDNTLAGFHNHGDLEVDLYVHSLTKYASGHGDVMGGAILGTSALIEKIRPTLVNTGATLDPHAAYLILRGIKTYGLRYERHCQNALRVAQWLESCPKVTKVSYPGLKSHPDHELVISQQKDFGGVVTFDVKGSTLDDFISRLRVFSLAPSLGSTESLVSPAKMFFGGDMNAEQCARCGLTDQTVRLAIGLESVEDLIADLSQAINS